MFETQQAVKQCKAEIVALTTRIANLKTVVVVLNRLDRVAESIPVTTTVKSKGKRQLSVAARKRIAAAQKARWAKWKAAKVAKKQSRKLKRVAATAIAA